MKFKKYLKVTSIILLIISICNFCYAKYMYNFEEVIIEFTKDVETPNYEILYSPNEITNQNVVITINTDEEIEQISGFTLSEDKKTSTKEVTNNEEETVLIRDLSGNYIEVKYSVSNIDKEPPQINGCEDGGVYKSPLELSYDDTQSGVQDVKIDKYDDELDLIGCRNSKNMNKMTVYIDKHPINTEKYRYYIDDKLYTTIYDTKYTITGLDENKEYKVKVEALNKDGEVLDIVILKDIREYYEKDEEKIDENNLIRKWKLSNYSN